MRRTATNNESATLELTPADLATVITALRRTGFVIRPSSGERSLADEFEETLRMVDERNAHATSPEGLASRARLDAMVADLWSIGTVVEPGPMFERLQSIVDGELQVAVATEMLGAIEPTPKQISSVARVVALEVDYGFELTERTHARTGDR